MNIKKKLFNAIIKDDLEQLKYLWVNPKISGTIDVNQKIIYGSAPIHVAADKGNTKIIAFLFEKGADVNVKNEEGETPLHEAVKYGHKDASALFIEKGADVNAKNKHGNTPLHYAIENNLIDIAALLIEKGADMSAKDGFDRTILFKAALNENTKMISSLIDKGADVNVKGRDGLPLLHQELKEGHVDIVNLLIEKGADVNAADEYGQVPLDYAVGIGDKSMISLLIKKGADVNVHKPNGKTLLDSISFNDRNDIAGFLKTQGLNAEEMKIYHNMKWNLTLVYPPDWEIMWENEPERGWEIIVGLAGNPSRSGRPWITIRILPHAVINLGPAHVSVFAVGGTGAPMEISRTPEEYNELCKQELKNVFPDLRFISQETGTLAGMPTATLVYSYKGHDGTIRETQIILFGTAVTYRLICEAPEDQIESTEKYFYEVMKNFKPAAG